MAPLTRRRKAALAAIRRKIALAAIHRKAALAAIRRKIALAAAPPLPPVMDPADRISRLPEEIQAQILSFLPALEAVRTCVLARTWRHVWRLTRRLLITGKSVREVRESVDRLLLVRRDVPLDASEIRFDPWVDVEDAEEAYLDDDEISIINRWICRVLRCQIQTLRVDISSRANWNCQLHMGTTPLLDSRHLTRLELTGISFTCRWINLDGCPQLEHLEIKECCLDGVRKITSLSLRRLVITSCDTIGSSNRIRICVPRLLLLRLDLEDVRTPRLDRMPELVAAKVQINSFQDECSCENPMDCYHVTGDGGTSHIHSDSDSDISDIDSDSNNNEEGSGDYAGQNITKSVLLDLVLIDDTPTYIFRRDLRWCPTFSKLKTLVLTYKYRHEPADCSVLECMLEHAPLLEKLTLNLKKVPREGKFKVEIKGYPDAKVKSAKISQQLQIVEINCEHVNGVCLNVLNFLATLNKCFETRVTKYDEETTISLNP